MTRHIATAALVLSLFGAPILVGCDRTVKEHQVQEKKADGTTVTHDAKTVEKPDGTVQTKTENKTTPPSNNP